MKSFILASFLIATVESTSRLRGGGTSSSSSLIGRSKNKYELKKVFEVEGRQGIATNGTHYFNSASKGLYVYDMEGNLLNKNENPFDGMDPPVNHFGDIGYYNGHLYTGVEWFEDGRGQDISCILYDPDTLNATITYPWNEDSGQVEVSALAVDTDNALVWITDWVQSNYIYAYNLEDGEYVGKLHLRATPTWTQGISFYKGDAYITADDGDADRKEDDNIWRINSEDLHNNATYIHHEMAFPGLDYGEIEGLDFNKETNELIVLANRGQRIVLGMPKDFYPGYDREIHEVYVYSIIDEEDETESSVIA